MCKVTRAWMKVKPHWRLIFLLWRSFLYYEHDEDDYGIRTWWRRSLSTYFFLDRFFSFFFSKENVEQNVTMPSTFVVPLRKMCVEYVLEACVFHNIHSIQVKCRMNPPPSIEHIQMQAISLIHSLLPLFFHPVRNVIHRISIVTEQQPPHTQNHSQANALKNHYRVGAQFE